MTAAVRVRLVLIVIFASSTMCLTSFCQTATATSTAEARLPSPEMRSLAKAFVGRWSTTYKYEPGGMAANGGTGKGEEVWRTGPGGYTLMEEEHIQAPFGEVFLFALQWWDKSTEQSARHALQQLRACYLQRRFLLSQFPEVGRETASDRNAVPSGW